MIPAALLALAALPQAPQRALDPIPLERVKISHEFFVRRLEANTRATLPQLFSELEASGRVRNFALVAGRESGEHTGRAGDDADVYRALEAVGWTLASIQVPDLAARADALIEAVVAAQAPDGYLHTAVQAAKGSRWADLAEGRELANAGALIEAGVAYARGTGRTKLLDAALRTAALVEAEFGPGKRAAVGGQGGIEFALMRLHEHTSDARWLALAKAFVDRRGDPARADRLGERAQDHAPIRAQTQVAGDLADAARVYAAATDVALASGDAELLAALGRLYTDAWSRVDVTGAPAGGDGCGACAGLALAQWAQRLLYATGEARYADAVETVLYNHAPALASLAGTDVRAGGAIEGPAAPRRVPAASALCCLGELARFWPQVPGMIFAQNGNTLYVTQLAGAAVDVVLAGSQVNVQFKSELPNAGRTEAVVTADRPATWNIKVRKPGWNVGARVKHDLKEAEHDLYDNEHAEGWVPFERAYEPRDGLFIHFFAPVRRVSAGGPPGRVALLRGPLVHALEGLDNGDDARGVFLPPDAELKVESVGTILGGTRAIRARARRIVAGGEPKVATLTAIPWWLAGNRAASDLVVWIPESADGARAPGQ